MSVWRRVLWLWGGLLVAALCLIFLPSPARWLALVLVITGIAGLFFAVRQKAADDAAEMGSLPPEESRLPVVLVCGDHAHMFPDGQSVHACTQGVFLSVPALAEADALSAQVLRQRPGWRRQLSVMMVINSQQHDSDAELQASLYELRLWLVRLKKITRREVPLILVSQVANGVAENPCWLVWRAGETAFSRPPEAPGFHPQVMFSTHRQWLEHHVLPGLVNKTREARRTPPCLLALCQTGQISGIRAGSLWQQWLQQQTALNAVQGWHSDNDAAALPLPDFLLTELPQGDGLSERRRALRRAVTCLALATAVALCISARNNRHLMHQVAADIEQYNRIRMTDHGPKAHAVAVLREDAARLDTWFRDGEPWRLGFGLYQGERLRPPLLAAIRGYIPPPPEQKPDAPQTVRLDALSLFDTGKWALKPGSTKILVSALVNIKARPGWLIVVAGHTDNTGEDNPNQVLSLKRAEAVRDWMRDTGDVPESCFAVQGYGESRPYKTNDTPEGRAANRRVEISLVPQADACRVPGVKKPSPEGGDITAK
ncbi:OmpA family protein [Salmonella enterica subsp. enterica]|nr:OmpA family protein [Salmonella enterica subsp. enterica]